MEAPLFVYVLPVVNNSTVRAEGAIGDITMKSYTVKYRIVSSGSSTNASTTVMLHSPNESEAIAALKQRGTVGRDKDIIILSIS